MKRWNWILGTHTVCAASYMLAGRSAVAVTT